MAAQTPANKAAADFNALIQADRDKRKAEHLAKDIFGRNRRQSAPNSNAGIRKAGSGGNLASRISTVPKPVQRQPVVGRGGGSVAARYARNAPAASSNIDKVWTHDLHSQAASIPTGPKPRKQNVRAARLASALNTASAPNLNSQVNILKPKGGFSIKGIAGPAIVQAANFAPGTTAADIESAMLTVGGKVLSTKLIATSPTVIAEIVMESRETANAVVDTFNGQTADGRILKLFVKPGEVTMADIASQPTASSVISSIPSGPRSQNTSRRSDNTSSESQSRPDLVRRVSDNYRPNYDARAEVIDGSYGFEEDRMDTDEAPRQMYSDNIVPQKNGSRNANGNTPIPRGPANGGRGGGRGRGGYGRYR